MDTLVEGLYLAQHSKCSCMLSCFSDVQLLAALWIVAHQASLSKGFSRQDHWIGLSCPPPEDLPDPGIEPRPHTLQADSLPSEPLEKLLDYIT